MKLKLLTSLLIFGIFVAMAAGGTLWFGKSVEAQSHLDCHSILSRLPQVQ